MAGKSTKDKSSPKTEPAEQPKTEPPTPPAPEPSAGETQAQKPVPIKPSEGVTFTSGRLDGYRLVLGNAPHETIKFERGIAVVTDPDLIARARNKPEFGVEFHEV